MKIGLVCPYNMTKGGGVQEIVLALREGLIARGHDVKILAPRPRDYNRNPKGMILLGAGADFKSPTDTTAHFSVSVNNNDIDEVLTRENFDVLHFHEPWVPILSRQILSRSSCVNVATFHAKLPETMMSRTVARVVTPYTKSVLKYLHSFTAVSDAAVEYLRTMTDEPVFIIPNGINLHHYHAPRGRSTGGNGKDKTILYVGRLEKRKGVKYLLKAFALLSEKHPHIKLLIAGDGVDRDKLENYVVEHAIPNVKFLGYVTETKKRSLLREADLFCAPSLYGESFGIVLLEAMASGLVTVAGNNQGYASVLQGLGSLSLVSPKESEIFAKRLELLLYEGQLRRLWKNWAKDSINQYNYDRVVEQYEAVYEDALKHYG